MNDDIIADILSILWQLWVLVMGITMLFEVEEFAEVPILFVTIFFALLIPQILRGKQ